MRKVIVAGVLAALGVALIAIPASASFDHHFTVWEKASFHPTADGFRFRGRLVEPRGHDRVGRDHGECKIRQHHRTKCRGIIHLNGEIGGFGNIAISGDIGRHDSRVNVVGGSHDFNGVAGKLLLHNVNRRTAALHFDLVR
jgi:hypothetical protein